MKNYFKQFGKIFFILTLATFIVLPYAIADAGQTISGTYNSRNYKLYIPTGYQQGSPLPLLVMLHGCTQDPDQFATGTQANVLAETEKFLVLYPDQPSSANQNKCWNFFEPASQTRGSGEPAIIVGMVNNVKNSYTIDSDRVYVAGLSAGAYMSSVMAATYPDVFAAAGVGAGGEYKAATSMNDAFTAMRQGGPNPDTQGAAAKSAMGSYARPIPVIIFQGTSDYTVYPVNADQVAQQWLKTNSLIKNDSSIDNTADQTISGSVASGRTYKQYVYKDSTGREWVHKYMVDGMAHAWSGGNSGGSFTDPKGPNATQLMWAFFKNNPKNGTGTGGGTTPPPTGGTDTTAPITSVSPAGGTYTSAVTVTLSANEAATTYYTLNGTTPTTGSTKYTAPIAITATSTLKFFSVDTAGNAEAVKSQSYTINTSGTGGGTSNGKAFKSVASSDGFVGQLFADSKSTSVHKLGDKGMYSSDSYRTILSFDLSSIATTATITEAKLRIYRKNLTGSVTGISVDVKKGTFGTATLEQSDYSAAASATAVATMNVPAANNDFVEITLPASALQYLNKGGVTQFRLKASTAVNSASDVLEIYGGEDAAYAPVLTVTYQ